MPSFARALVFGVTGVVLTLGLTLIGVMLWQGISNTRELERQAVKEGLERGVGQLQAMVHAAEMLADSVERVARAPNVPKATLRQPLEHALSAFEQRPELSFLGIALPETGEYGNLERTANGEIRLWLFPGTRKDDPVRRLFTLAPQGFVLRDERPSDGYDPRRRPFYQAALTGPAGGMWMPAYQWIVHTGETDPLWGFSFVKAIRDADGRLLSVLDTDLDVPALNRFLSSLDVVNETHLQVLELGDTPRLIAGANVGQAPLPVPAEFASLVSMSSDTFIGQFDVEGERRWVAAQRIKLKGDDVSWLVIASRAAPLLQFTLRQQLLQVLGIGLAIAAGLVLISLRMTRRLGRPLAELERRVASIGVDQFAEAKEEGVSTASGFRETQLLSDAITRMSAVLREQELVKRQQIASLALKGAIFDSSTAAILSLDEELTIIEWNGAAERMFGVAREHVVGRHIVDVVTSPDGPVDWATVLNASTSSIHQLLGTHGAFEAELRNVNILQDGRNTYTLILANLSEHKRIEQQLREDRDYADAVLNSLPGIFYHVDQDKRLRRWNRNLERVTGYTPAELENATLAKFFADEDKPWVTRQIEEALIAGESAVEADCMLSDGRRIPYLFTGVRFDHDGNHGFVGVGTDISERKRAEERIRYLALYDDLTGLPNRHLMQERMEQAMLQARQTGHQFALLYVDLDRFQVVNDSYGRLIGDAMLKSVGERLLQLVGALGTVGHLGGDEFLILLPSHGAPEAKTVAAQIGHHLNGIVKVQERDIHLSVSIGLSVFPDAGETVHALIDNANMAMYHAKELGRNTCQIFTQEMGWQTQRRVDLEMKLRGAVNAGQLRLVYQPKVNLADGRISGCEALLRWHHPELGVVPPDVFIPIAEDSGLIVSIGDWVLRTACEQAKKWKDAGLPPLSVAVNVSAHQFLQQDVVAWVTNTLQEVGLPPAWLELELTESLIAQDIDKVTQTINQFKKLGVKLSIDDFGTGYSSLNYLKRFRVDTLKIDKSFIQNMLVEKEDETIVLAVISLAHSLNFKVLAEGVETAEHHRLLCLNGCDEMQGYFFSKPVTGEEFSDMLHSGRRLMAAGNQIEV